MAKKTAIDRAIEAMEAKKADSAKRAHDECSALQAAIDVLYAQRRTPKPRVVKQPAALVG